MPRLIPLQRPVSPGLSSSVMLRIETRMSHEDALILARRIEEVAAVEFGRMLAVDAFEVDHHGSGEDE